jgi:hypothetical protein
MTSLLATRAARRRSIAFTVLIAVSLVLMAFSANPTVRELQSGVGFAFRPIQGALDEVAGGVASIATAIAEIDRLRDSATIRDLIAREVPAGSTIAPMKHTDELYLSHYNKDRGGDQGLFDKHYDGNLRFLSSSIVVRALIYLQSDDTYKVVFADSRVEKAFTTYEFGLLDFHRELHWVEGAFNPADRQRILLKCNYLVTLPGGAAFGRVALAANTAVFYVVKAAMEYSKSPRTPAQVAVGFVCNLFRRLNIIHPAIPLALSAGVVAGLAAAIGYGVSVL